MSVDETQFEKNANICGSLLHHSNHSKLKPFAPCPVLSDTHLEFLTRGCLAIERWHWDGGTAVDCLSNRCLTLRQRLGRQVAVAAAIGILPQAFQTQHCLCCQACQGLAVSYKHASKANDGKASLAVSSRRLAEFCSRLRLQEAVGAIGMRFPQGHGSCRPASDRSELARCRHLIWAMRDANSNTEFSEANVARSVQAAVLVRSCVHGFSCRILWEAASLQVAVLQQLASPKK